MGIGLLLISILAITAAASFQCKTLFCCIAAVLCLGVVIADFIISVILKKKIPALLSYGIKILAMFISVILLLNTGMKTQELGLFDYNKMAEKLYQYIAEEEYDDAIDLIEDMEKYYGGNDGTCAFRTLELISEENYEEALEPLELMKDKNSKLYASLKLSIYIGLGEDANQDDVKQLIKDTAHRYPEWTMMQKLAGMAELHNTNYVGASYYLSRAYEQNSTDVDTLYYLGTAHFKNGNYEDALRFFEEAVLNGADIDMQGEILWYLNHLP